jgi:hypothetical protein
MNKEREKFNRRLGLVDRRKKKFGRRGPKWLVGLANWLTSNPKAFFAYIIVSLLLVLYSSANLAYNINELIIEFFKEIIK